MSLSSVYIDKQALIRNLRTYKLAIGKPKILSVVKSDAYGHGVDLVSKIIEPETNWFGVASGTEGLELRNFGIKKPILVLSFYEQDEVSELLQENISLALYNREQLDWITKAAKKFKTRARVHLKVDTGTSRLGVMPAEFAKFIESVLGNKHIIVEGIFSHFAASENDTKFTAAQINIFETVINELQSRGLDPIKHIACTASGVVAARSRYDMVRLGLGLFGLWPSEKTRKQAKFQLVPALSWYTQIIQVKDLPKGASVGYDRTFITKRPTKLAVLPVGYYDGYDRKLSNIGEVAIRGRRCRVLGRVCMNLTMIDVTNLKNVKVGDAVELIGNTITADELAQKIGTINYEVVTRINPLIPRILK